MLNQDNSELHLSELKWSITRSVSLSGRDVLPPNFPILVDADSGLVCEPVLLYVYDVFGPTRARAMVQNTVDAVTFDLKDWMQHLEWLQVKWNDATSTHLNAFVVGMRATYSPQSGQPYATATINRRQTSVLGMYRWAFENSYAPEQFPANSLFSTQATGRIKKLARDQAISNILKQKEASSLMSQLGPMPSSYCAKEINNISSQLTSSSDFPQTSLYRLTSEIALMTGMRISEVCNLKVRQIERLIQKKDIGIVCELKIMGKGSKSRTIDIPGHIVKELKLYIENERAAIIESSIDADAAMLFLNNAGGCRKRGKRLKVRTLQQKFSDACVECGLYDETERFSFSYEENDITNRQIEVFLKPRFTFHDLRHTYAVWTYYARKTACDSAPWLYIQKQLGHARLQTTMGVYLVACKEFEAQMSDRFMENIRG